MGLKIFFQNFKILSSSDWLNGFWCIINVFVTPKIRETMLLSIYLFPFSCWSFFKKKMKFYCQIEIYFGMTSIHLQIVFSSGASRWHLLAFCYLKLSLLLLSGLFICKSATSFKPVSNVDSDYQYKLSIVLVRFNFHPNLTGIGSVWNIVRFFFFWSCFIYFLFVCVCLKFERCVWLMKTLFF